jgi:peptide/nickel transport system ATP-binding protein
MKTKKILDVENLKITFETDRGDIPAVDGVSFDIKPGEILGICGESGSGKSVTARSIMRLIEDNGRVTADTLEFKGEDLLSKSEKEMNNIRGSEISIIFQDSLASLNPVISNGEQIAESVRHQGDTHEPRGFWHEMKRKYVTGTNKNSHSWQRALELLDMIGIPDPEQRAKEYPHQLSGGMRQRIMIAQAIAGNPSLLIADEPTTALDVSIESQILDLILQLRDEFNMAVIFISHDIGVIRETCDRGLVMYAGEVMENAKIDDLIEEPKHPYTKALIDSAPHIGKKQKKLNTIRGTIPDSGNRPTGCPFRGRCEDEFDDCVNPLVEHQLSQDRMVRCHLFGNSTETEKKGI